MKYEIAADLINIIVDVIVNASHKNSTYLEVTHALQRLKLLAQIPEKTKEASPENESKNKPVKLPPVA